MKALLTGEREITQENEQAGGRWGGALLLLLALHTIAWPLAAALYDGDVSVHYDMLESWLWGKEFQLGYFKHPPLVAWLAGLWFQIVPRTNFAFYLLASINSTLGLVAVWMIARRLLDRSMWLPAVALVMLAPFHGVLALKLNANTVLLSLFPWIVYAFLRSIETRRAANGVLFGLLAGLGMLTKYYTIVLLLCCLLASLLHADRRAYYRSPAPYLAVLAGSLVIAPHIYWMFESGFLTFKYAAHQSGVRQSFGQTMYFALRTLTKATAYHVLPLLVLFLVLGWRAWAMVAGGFAAIVSRDRLWLGVLILGPFALTLALGFLAHLKVTPNYVIPALSLFPVAALKVAPNFDARQRRMVVTSAIALLLAVCAAGAAARLSGLQPFGAQSREPSRALALAVTKEWRQATGKPLRISAGTRAYALAVPFYSPDAPSDFTHFYMSHAPWVSRERVAREGLLVVCVRGDLECFKKAASYLPADARRIELALPWPARRGVDGAIERFEVFIVAPR